MLHHVAWFFACLAFFTGGGLLMWRGPSAGWGGFLLGLCIVVFGALAAALRFIQTLEYRRDDYVSQQALDRALGGDVFADERRERLARLQAGRVRRARSSDADDAVSRLAKPRVGRST